MSKLGRVEKQFRDMLDMPHYQSKTRAHMSLHDRAAQFAPFAALTGYDEEIEETARLTDEKVILDDTAIEKINEKLMYLAEHLSEKPVIAITYFKPDKLKQGGAYLTDIGTIKKFEQIERRIVMDSGIKISMEQIVNISIENESGD